MPPKIDRIREVMTKASAGREVAIVFDNQTRSGLKGGITENNSWQIQGYVEEYKLSIYIHANAFSTTPKAQESISIDGEMMRILAVYPDSLGALIRLDLGGLYAY